MGNRTLGSPGHIGRYGQMSVRPVCPQKGLSRRTTRTDGHTPLRGCPAVRCPLRPRTSSSLPPSRARVCRFFFFQWRCRAERARARPEVRAVAQRACSAGSGRSAWLWRLFGPNAPARVLRGKLRGAKRWSALLAWLLAVSGQIGAVALLTISFCSRASWQKSTNHGAFRRHVAPCRRLLE